LRLLPEEGTSMPGNDPVAMLPADGVELGEPHWHPGAVATLLGAGQFDRVLGSLHSLPLGQQFALRALAHSSRALEINTSRALCPEITRWWHEEGGPAVTFGSDAHDPAGIAHHFAEAAAMAEAIGFRPGRHPCDYWKRLG
jgi:hypothetical protein